MTNDELYLRHRLKRWERRFVDNTAESIVALIKLKDDFAQKYGLPELEKVQREVTLEVARELSP